MSLNLMRHRVLRRKSWPIEHRDGHFQIVVRGVPFLIDDQDHDDLVNLPLSVLRTKKSTYLVVSQMTSGKRENFSFHRLILGLEKHDERLVDHINGDSRDNRRANLRIVSKRENSQNRTDARGASGFRGVVWFKPRSQWCAKVVTPDGKQHCRYFKTREEAMEKRIEMERELFGEYAPSRHTSK